MPNRYALGFSLAAFCYVVVECAIYVWMPTLLAGFDGPGAALVGYALPAFFVMRALGRFLGAWLLRYFDWSAALAIAAAAIFACFAGSAAGGVGTALYLLPLAGLFMSIMYPTINSKGLGCFQTPDHGAVAGIILFFTCAGAFLGPLTMGLVSDAFGGARYGFLFATVVAACLAAGFTANWDRPPASARGYRLRRRSPRPPATVFWRVAVVIFAVADNPWRRPGGGSSMVTTTLKSFASSALVVEVVVPVVVPVSRPTALSPIWVTRPLKVLFG